MKRARKVVQVPFCFYPDPVGGTEVYVEALSRCLQSLDWEVTVAAVSKSDSIRTERGLRVRGLAATENFNDLDALYGEGDELAAVNFGQILDEERPDLVHLHAFTSAVSVRLANEVKKRNLPLIFTYHTPAVSCRRGTLMRWGCRLCDGILRVNTCSQCTLHGLGMGRMAAFAVGSVPSFVGTELSRFGLQGGPWTALRMTSLVKQNHQALRKFLTQTSHIIAVTDWVKDVLIRNGVDLSKVTVIRHGLCHEIPDEPIGYEYRSTANRFIFLGRLDPTKGVHVAIHAFMKIQNPKLSFHIYGISQGEYGNRYEMFLRNLAARDHRIQFFEPVTNDAVIGLLKKYDALIVPSQAVETGPLVVLEAFAAGIAVIGSKLGGIADLVRDGKDGILVKEQASADSWRHAFQEFSEKPEWADQLKKNVHSPESMESVTRKIIEIYMRAL